MRIYIILLVLTGFAFVSCGIKKDPLSEKWAKYIQSNPGNSKVSKSDALTKYSKLLSEAEINSKSKKYLDAIKCYELALDFYASPEGYYDFGNYYSNISKDSEAIKAYQISLSLGNKQVHLVYYNIACSYSKMENRDKCVEYLYLAVKNGYKSIAYMNEDNDLAYMHKQQDWNRIISNLEDEMYKDNMTMPHTKKVIITSAADTVEYYFSLDKVKYYMEFDSGDNFKTIKCGTWKLSNNQIMIHFTKEIYQHNNEAAENKQIDEGETLDWSPNGIEHYKISKYYGDCDCTTSNE